MLSWEKGKTRLGWEEVWIGWRSCFCFFADVLADFGEELYTREELFLFCICLYGSFLYLGLGEERKYEFITVLCKVLLGRLISVK